MEMAWADKLELKGRRLGRSEGRRLGRSEGRAEGFRQALEVQLAERFGSLDEVSRRRLAAIDDLEHLKGLSRRLLTAKSLADLGLATARE